MLSLSPFFEVHIKDLQEVFLIIVKTGLNMKISSFFFAEPRLKKLEHLVTARAAADPEIQKEFGLSKIMLFQRP